MTRLLFTDLLPKVSSGSHRFVDFGCGHGQVLAHARKYGTFDAIVGIELNPFLYHFCRMRFIFDKRVTILRQNYWDFRFQDGDMIFAYIGKYFLSL